ncbi:hypothetical protein [Acinetobacter sp. WCHAc060025]|uniref:phage tail tube protein n=1 Tax=Acinetobacter sp. WCHAc060025 TaxID=2518625 RepID=UPI00102362B7|nr:hypothetical protein [Acinetobacter sp. WCHAc060025]RZG76638.1 hypothetical protein EXE09_06285 [Acinetobacter sp. WCHAc060025]
MANNPDLISLQGEFFLAKITNGVAGNYVSAGPMPDLKVKITAETKDHFDPRYGFRAKDAVLRKAVGLELSGTLEEFSKQNRNILFSAQTADTEEKPIADLSIGSVKAGEMINLGYRNLKEVTFKSGSATTIEPSKYSLDLVYGTVTFNEAITENISWSGTAGAIERSVLAVEFGVEYAGLFKGVDTYQGDKIVADFWRLQFSPETEFDLINEDFAEYPIKAEALMDNTKALDPVLGPFGGIERFKV